MISHPIFGGFSYRRGDWESRITCNDGPIDIAITGDKKQPDPELLQLAESIYASLSHFQAVAVSYITSKCPDILPRELVFVALEIFRPAKGWIEQTLMHNNPDAARLISRETPLFSLQYSIVGDRNVVDVIFKIDQPIDLDYH